MFKWEKIILIAITVFIGLSLLSLVNTENFDEAIKQSGRIFRFILIIPIYLVARRFKVITGINLLYSMVLGAAILVIEAWYEINILNYSVAHGAYHKIIFGDTAMLLSCLLGIGIISGVTNTRQTAFYIFGISAGIYASALSVTRGAWSLLPILIAVWLWMYRHNIKKHIKILAASFSILIVIGVAWQPSKIIDGIYQGIADLKTYQSDPTKNTSWGVRINLWRDSLTILAKHPIIGTGIGDLSIDRQRLADNGKANNIYLSGNQAHSIYFQALATRGTIGFLALVICLFMVPLVTFYKFWDIQHEPWQRFNIMAAISVIIAFAVFGISEGWLTRNPFVNSYIIFLIIFMNNVATRLAQADSDSVV